MTKTNITSRAGQFTSSSVYKLMGNAKKPGELSSPAVQYINEKTRERKLCRQLSQEKSFRASAWGTMLQHRVLNVMIGLEYSPCSNTRKNHELYPWSGSADFTTVETAGDVKCLELDNFTKTHDAATAGWETLKEECDDIAWQLVSNSILYGKSQIELVLYVPYQDELSIIRDEKEWDKVLSGNTELLDSNEFKWWLNYIQNAKDEELPYLLKEGEYPNLSKFIFDVTESDVTNLTNKIILATEKLNQK
jgi:hypothetical protein